MIYRVYMSKKRKHLVQLFFAWFLALAFVPLGHQTIEEACKDPSARVEDASVRVAWTDVETDYDDVRVTFCVLRGDRDAKLAFERDAEIVYFALANVDRRAERRNYTFTIRTSHGRLIRQGPAMLQPLAKQPVSCRVDVCQFFTEPGERVTSVSVESSQEARRR
jgi:hypothetical protein